MSVYGAPWTEERVAEMTRRRIAGESASEIARGLGRVTRNAVIGKLKRLGIEFSRPGIPGARTVRPARPPRETRPTAPRRIYNGDPHDSPDTKRARNIVNGVKLSLGPNMRPLRQVEATCEPIGLLELEATSCRWPVNDGAPDWRFCGARKAGEGPYCSGHAALAVGATAPSGKEMARKLRWAANG